MNSITYTVNEQENTEINETFLWEETNKQLELRERLLEQSVQFYKSAKIFSEKMNQATTAFERLTENKVSNTERGYDLIEQHQKVKKGWISNKKIKNDPQFFKLKLFLFLFLCR